MKKKLMQMYLRRAEEIIGERTPAEIAHDDEVVAELEKGLPIEAALANAARKHPSEALQWDADSIGDIAAHYDYLKEHVRIMKMMQGKKPTQHRTKRRRRLR
jgi:hypothetical protein